MFDDIFSRLDTITSVTDGHRSTASTARTVRAVNKSVRSLQVLSK